MRVSPSEVVISLLRLPELPVFFLDLLGQGSTNSLCFDQSLFSVANSTSEKEQGFIKFSVKLLLSFCEPLSDFSWEIWLSKLKANELVFHYISQNPLFYLVRPFYEARVKFKHVKAKLEVAGM